tara:strand:+ start:254 stop:436 length:183 start_codon:yes stop_codon:yes gene_type:complete
MMNYEAMYRAVIDRLVEIANEVDNDSGRTFDEYNRDRLTDYDRVARSHEKNIKKLDEYSL